MDARTRLYARAVLAEPGRALRPLVPAAENPYELFGLLGRLGWKLDGMIEAQSAPLRSALDAVREALTRAAEAGSNDTPERMLAVVSAELRDALGRMNEFGDVLLATTLPAPDGRLARELALDLTDYLCTEYLRREWPTLFAAASLLRLITHETAAPLFVAVGSESVQVRFPVARWQTRTGDLVSLAADPLARLLGGGGAGAADRLQQLLGSLSDQLVTVQLMRDGRGFGGVSATLGPRGLTLRGGALPLLPPGAPPLTLVLPVPSTPVLKIDQESISIDWTAAPVPAVSGAGPVLFDAGGFTVSAVGAGDGAGVTLEESEGRLRCRVEGGLEVRLPAGVLRGGDGGHISATAQASLLLAAGEQPRVSFETLRASLDGLTLAGGLRVESALIELRGLTFPLPENGIPYRLIVEGRLALPAGDAQVGVRAVMAADGFELTSTGQVCLGDGIRLHPVVDGQGEPRPVLRAAVGFGDTAGAEFEVRGGVDIPTGGGEPLRVEVGGHLSLRVAAGRVSVESFDAAGELHSELRLPGGATLRAAAASIAYDTTAGRFSAALGGDLSISEGVSVQGASGAARLHASLLFNTADPLDVSIDGTIDDVRLELVDEVRVFGGALRLALRTRPPAGEPPLTLGLQGGTAALFRRQSSATGTADDYFLAVADLAASFTLFRGGFDLLVSGGHLLLPSEFFSAGAAGSGRPAVGAGTPGHPLALHYREPSELSFSGSLTFHDFGVRLPAPSGGELVARLDAATLLFTGRDRPALKGVSGSLTVPLPDGAQAVVGFDDVEWDLAGLPTGEIALLEELPIPLGGEFVLSLLPREATPGARPPGTRLSVTRGDGPTPYTQFHFDAAVRLTVPEGVLAAETGGAVERVTAESSGWLTFTTLPGASPQIGISTLAFGGDFRLGGGTGLRLKGARISALGLEYLLDRGRDEEHSFTLALDGTVEFPDGGPSMGLEHARFIFDGATIEDPPRFRARGFSFAPGQWVTSTIPLAVREASLRFDDEDLPPSELLAPTNLTLGLSLEVAIPMGEKAGLMGRVDGVRVSIDPDGLPRVRLQGIGFGVENLTIGSTILSGVVYMGGLTGDPRDIYFVGKLGGTMSGTGVFALVGFQLVPPKPLGLCLDVRGGSSGIPLGQTGIMLTGVSGGVSFANTSGSPCDFKSYLPHDAEGKPTAGPKREAPAGVAPAVKDQLDAGNPIAAPGCPCACPPPSMNVFCQPHPDRERFPERAIIKFSSLDEDFLKQCLRDFKVTLPGAGEVSRETLESIRLSTPDEIAALTDAVAGEVVHKGVRSLWPDAPGELPPVITDKLNAAQAELTARLTHVMREAGADRTLWEAIRDEAYRGLPCPDVTIEVTATFSYTGVSAFLSITGGCSLSTTGAAGIIGWLNVVGIPVGRFKGFLVATSEEGDLDPAICGELNVSVGPLEFGKMNAQLDCRGLITGVRDALAATAADFGGPVVREALGVLAPAVERRATAAGVEADTAATVVERKLLGRDYDEWTPQEALELLPRLDGGQASAVVTELLRLASERVTSDEERRRLTACALDLVERVWKAFEPKFVLCGKVQPKIFGMATGAALVDGTAFITKRGLGASCAFSPLYLLAWGINAATATLCTILSPLLAGLEQAVLGFALALPDFMSFFLDAAERGLPTREELEAKLDAEAERLLSSATLVAGYRLSPMGLTLFNSAARYLLPDFTDHPARPGSSWGARTPEEREQLTRTRIELLESILALRPPRFADASWNGDLGAAGMPGKMLGKDFFPHGGLIGAARIVVPRALLDAPPLDTFRLILDDRASILERFRAAFGYVNDYLLKAEEVGTFAFYTPAPNPPTFAVNGHPLSPETLRRCIMEPRVNFDSSGTPSFDLGGERLSAEELLRRVIEPESAHLVTPGSVQVGPLWSLEESFMLGVFEARLLGVPVFDARMEFVAPEGRREGYLLVTGKIPEGSWLRPFASAALRFEMHQPPPLPMDVHFRALSAALGIPFDDPARAAELATAGAEEVAAAALAAAPSTPADASALLARVREWVDREAETLAREQLGRSLPPDWPPPPSDAVEASLRDFRVRLDEQLQPLADSLNALAASVAGAGRLEGKLRALLAHIADSLVRDMPKVSLEVDAELTLPQEVAPLVGLSAGAKAKLYAYSPYYEPQTQEKGARADAMRRGGIVASASLDFSLGTTGLRITVEGAEFKVEPPGLPASPPDTDATTPPAPRLSGDFSVKDVTLPGPVPLTLRRAGLHLDSRPAPGRPVLAVTGVIDPIRIGAFRIEPLDGGPSLRGTLAVLADGAASLLIEPARLTLPLIGGQATMRIHGVTTSDPFTLSTIGVWDASLRVEGEPALGNPAGPAGPALLAVEGGKLTARLSGVGLEEASLTLSASEGLRLVAFPKQRLEQRWSGAVTLSLDADSRGRAALEVSGVSPLFPTEVTPFLAGRGKARLHAYSRGYDPDAQGAETLARARRDGGVVLVGEVEFLAGGGESHLGIRAGEFELGIVTARLPSPPRLFGRASVGEVLLPFSSLSLTGAALEFDSKPPRGVPLLRVAGGLSPLRIGAFGIEPKEGDAALRASLEMDREGVATLRIEPARLTLAGATVLRLHGDTPAKPFSLGSDGRLAAGVSLSSGALSLRVPFAPAPPVLDLRLPASEVKATLRGRLGFAELELEADAGASLSAFPGASYLREWVGSGSLTLLLNSEGRFALVLRGVTGPALPPPLSKVVSLSAGAETRLVAYSFGYDPGAAGDTPLARIRREGGVALRTSLTVKLGPPPSAFELAAGEAELAILPPPGGPPVAGGLPQTPRLVGSLAIRKTLDQEGWLGLRLRSLRLDTHPEAGVPLLTLAAEMPGIDFHGFTLNPNDASPSSVLRPRLALYPDGDLRLEVEPARLGHHLFHEETLLLLHGAGEGEPLRLSTKGTWTTGVTLQSDVLVQSPFDPSDPPLLRVPARGADGSALSVTLNGTGLRPDKLSLVVPPMEVKLFPGQRMLERVFVTRGFKIEALAGGGLRLDLDLPPLTFGAFVIHGDNKQTPGDDPSEWLKVSVSPYGFSIAGARLRLIPLKGPSLRLSRFVISGRGGLSTDTTGRTFTVQDFFHFSCGDIHLTRAGEFAVLSLRKPRLGLNLPWRPRLGLVDGASRPSLLPPGPDVNVGEEGLFAYRHPKPVRVGVAGVVQFRGTLEAGTARDAAGTPEPFIKMTDAAVDLPALPNWSGGAVRLALLKPTGFHVSYDSGKFGVPGLVEFGGAFELDFEFPSKARLAATGLNVRLFGSFDYTLPSLDLSIADGDFEVTLDLPSVPLVPGVLELREGRGKLSRNGGTAHLECAATVLGRHMLEATFTHRTQDGPRLRVSLNTGIDLLRLGDLLHVYLLSNSLLLIPREGGGFEVRAHLHATFLGEEDSPEVLVQSDGRVTWPWPRPLPLPFGLVSPKSHDTQLSFDLLDEKNRDLRLRLFGNIATAAELPDREYRLTCQTTESIPLMANLLELGGATWTLSRQNDTYGVGFDGKVRVLGVETTARWEVRGSGAFPFQPLSTYNVGFDVPPVTLLSGLIELDGVSFALARGNRATSLKCSAKVFDRPTPAVNFTNEGPKIRASFNDARGLDLNLDLLRLGDLLDLDLLANSLLLTPLTGGGFGVRAHLHARFFDFDRSDWLDLSVGNDGRVGLPLPGGINVPLGPFTYTSGGAHLSFDARHADRRALRVRLFGIEHTVVGQDDEYTLTCETTEWKTLIPAVLRLGPATWTLSRQGGADTIGFGGQVELLQDGRGSWKVHGTSQFSFRRQDDSFHAFLFDTPAFPTVSALSGLLKITVPDNAFYFDFNRAASVPFSAGVLLDAEVFGQTLRPNLRAGLSGAQATAGWPGGSFTRGLFKLKPTHSRVVFDLLTRSAAGCRLEFDGGAVEFPNNWGLDDMRFGPLSLGGGTLSATLSHDGKEKKDWQRIGILAAEFHLASPTLRLVLRGTDVTPYLDAGPLQVRSTEAKDGKSLAEATLKTQTPDGSFTVPVATNGTVSLSFPALPDLRSACRAEAYATAERADEATGGLRISSTQAMLNAALAVCNALPTMPDLSGAGPVAVSSLIDGWETDA